MGKSLEVFYRKYRKTGKGGSYREMEWALRGKGVPEPSIVAVLDAIRASRAELAQYNLNEARRQRALLNQRELGGTVPPSR